MNIKRSILFLAVVLTFLTVQSQEQPDEKGNAAANATNPLAFVTKLQVQPNFTWGENGGRTLNITSRIIQPTASVLLPFIKSADPSKIYTIYRLEVPLIGKTTDENNSMGSVGMGDLVLLDAVVFKQKWGLLGTGPALSIPTMKPENISSRKWAAGAMIVALNTKTKGWQWGVLAQQFFSFGGDAERESQSYMLFQPIVNRIVGKGVFVQFNPIMSFNWTNSSYHVPLTVSVGKAFAKNLSVSLAPEYVVSGPVKGDFTFRFNLNAMFPPSK